MWMDVDTAVQVPVSLMPLVGRTDFITIEDAIAFDEAGMAVAWNFVTTAGVMTTTAITPTSASDHDWLEEGTDQGMYSIEIPASAGDANNDTEGVGWITGETNSCLPFRGPTVGFRAAALNNALIDGGDTLDVNVTAMAANVVTAAAIADAAIDNATFAADVGSTAYATNIIALAVRKVLDEIKLDHLVAVAESDDPVNDSIIAKLAASDGDWSGFAEGTDSLEAIRDAAYAGGDITGDLSGSVGSVTGAVGSVGGNVDGSVGSVVGELNSGGTISTLDALDTALDARHTATQLTLQGLVLAQGTIGATGNSTTKIHLDGLAYANDDINGYTLVLKDDSTGLFHRTTITDFATSGDLATVPTLNFTPEASTDLYWLLPVGSAYATWDEILTGASHNIATSAGRRLRQIEQATVLDSGTITNVGDGHTFTLDTSAVATTDYYVGARLQIAEGTGAGQSRVIVGYTSSKVVTLDSDFVTNPDTLSLYEVDVADVHVAVSDADLAEGFVAVATSTTQITLDAGAVATTDYYVGELIVFTHGLGAGQAREITGYTSGRVVTMSPALVTALDTTTTWHIQAVVSIPEIVDEVWDEDATGHQTQGTFGQAIGDPAADADTIYGSVVTGAAGANIAVDIIALKVVADALDTLTKAAGDGDLAAVKTAADAVKVVTDKFAFTVANQVDGNMLAISGSTDAADKLEASAETIVIGAAEAGTLSTTQMTSDLAEATDDHYNGRIIIWTSGVLIRQATDITDYLGATGLCTFTAVTEAPSAADTFVIV